MKEESSPRANDILRRVRGSADPQPRDEARVLARVEQRLGMISQLEAFRAPAPRRVNGGAHGHASSAALRAPLQQLLGALPRLGLWTAFGLSMAAIGYGVGTRGKESQRTDVAAVVRSPEAAAPALLAARPAPVVAAPPVAAPAAAAAPVVAEPVVAKPDIVAPVVATRPSPVVAAPVAAPAGGVAPAASSSRRRAVPMTRSALVDDVTASETLAPSTTSAPGAAPVAVQPEAIGLREALQLLERAQAAVRLGTAGDALDWLGQLERRNPGPLLEQERLVTRALAQCALGEVAQARATRRQLERLEPESIYRGQLDASCAKKE